MHAAIEMLQFDPLAAIFISVYFSKIAFAAPHFVRHFVPIYEIETEENRLGSLWRFPRNDSTLR